MEVRYRDQLGNGLKHDRIDDFFRTIETPSLQFTTDDPFTIEFWGFLETTPTFHFNNCILSNRAVSDSSSISLSRTFSTNGILRLQLQNGSSQFRWTMPNGTPNGWHKIYCVYSGNRTNAHFVIDGVRTDLLPSATPPPSINLFTGFGMYSGINGADGLEPSPHTYYKLRVWNKALSDTEIANLSQGDHPATIGGNVLWLDFNQDRGIVLPDISGNGNQATLFDFGSTTDKDGGAWIDLKGNNA